MKSKHTPGPWSLNEPTLIWAESVGENVAKTHIEDWDVIPREQMEANARLIAAAPELLEACLAMMRYQAMIESEDEIKGGLIAAYAEAFEGAEAAIAKATGGV